MTFEAWLKKQQKRDDPIGDLARDFYSCKKPYEKCDKNHLYKHDAPKIVFNTLKIALDEYENQ